MWEKSQGFVKDLVNEWMNEIWKVESLNLLRWLKFKMLIPLRKKKKYGSYYLKKLHQLIVQILES